jgi:hypothetical protein
MLTFLKNLYIMKRTNSNKKEDSMATYYIDNKDGSDLNSGISECCPKRDYRSIDPAPGDRILFKRGTSYNEGLRIKGGADDAPITYGAYAKGSAPVFSGSIDVSSPKLWEAVRPNIWKCTANTQGDVGNFILDGNPNTATFRWTEDELSAQGDFYDPRCFEQKKYGNEGDGAYMYSESNPGEYYSHIEAVPYGGRVLVNLQSNVIVEDLCFMNSGVHALAGAGRNITVRGCSIKNIGGCAWNRDLRIRFGNAIEFWINAENVLIENNVIENVYDSCVTHQGPGDRTVPAVNFVCRANRFDTYGMAAFEYRDKMMRDSSFTDNVCTNAGCGFAMLGEDIPRRSEIWPQPMGHHVFLWRIDTPTEGGGLRIQRNKFGYAPQGAAIYSIICPEAEAQMIIDNNTYTENNTLLVRFGGVNYSSLSEYVSASGMDKSSKYS